MFALGPQPSLSETTYVSFDGDRFPYSRWLPREDPKTVVIGLHGIAGASTDLRILAEHLLTHHPSTAVYAPDLRGQGNDPLLERRGDIRCPSDWILDLHTFSRLVRARHPNSNIVWCGESMGSLIALHAASTVSERSPPCDVLILSSPIARIRSDLPLWRRTALRWAALLLPRFKLSLESLSGETETRVIRDTVHQEQVSNNDYHLSEFTCRLLNVIARLIERMPDRAEKLSVPVLLLHGGEDVFSHADDVASFATSFHAAPMVDRYYYPESYHLLFYDHERERILADLSAWLKKVLPT